MWCQSNLLPADGDLRRPDDVFRRWLTAPMLANCHFDGRCATNLIVLGCSSIAFVAGRLFIFGCCLLRWLFILLGNLVLGAPLSPGNDIDLGVDHLITQMRNGEGREVIIDLSGFLVIFLVPNT